MTQNSVDPGSELASLAVSLRDVVFPAGPSALLLRTIHGVQWRKGYPISTPLSQSRCERKPHPDSRTWNPGWDSGAGGREGPPGYRDQGAG